MGLDAVKGDFARYVQYLLRVLVLDAAEILAEMHVQKPVHRLDRPFEVGAPEQFPCGKFPTGNIVMPLVARLALVLELAAYRPHARKVFPSGIGQPSHLIGDEPGAGFQPTPVLLKRFETVHGFSQRLVPDVFPDVLFQRDWLFLAFRR